MAAVGLRIGPSAGELSSPRWTETDSELPTSRSIFLAIDPRAEHLKAGDSLTYCLVAKDSKGQVTESQPYKLSIAAPDKVAAADTARPPASLDNLLQALHQAATAPRNEDAATKFLASLPPALREAVDAAGRFRRPDGKLMSDDEVRKLVESAHAD